MTVDVAEIEALAFDAWPAAEVVVQDGWRLRWNHGVTQRASSVWPAAGGGGPPLAERIAAAEAFYAERGAGAIFQITPLSPEGLDAALAERGYERHSPVRVQVADAARVAEIATPAVESRCSELPDEEWLELAGARGRYHGDAEPVFRALLARIRDRRGFGLARPPEGRPASLGLCVARSKWAGIFAMRTVESARRRGLARAVLRGLASWALAAGAERLYLQVEEENAAALALYAHAGFEDAYRYHYRRFPGVEVR